MQIYDYFLIALLLFILGLMMKVLLPFSGALLLSVVMGVLFHPFHSRLRRRLPKHSDTTAALLSDGIVLLFFIVPLALLFWMIIHEADTLSPALKQWRMTLQTVQDGGVDSITPLRHIRQWLTANLGIQPSMIRETMGTGVESMIGWISLSAGSLAKHSMGLMIDGAVMLITLFFVFKDGPVMLERFLRYVPLRHDIKTEMVQKVHETLVGVMRGVFLTCLVQGVIAAAGYLIAGVPGVTVLGFLTAVAALIPSVGTALIWLPLAIFYLLKQAYFPGLFLLGWGFLVVGLVDNWLRPYLISERAELPFLALFFGLLGGIEVWGAKGILIGPLVMSVLPVLLEAWRKRYLSSSETVKHK